MKRLFIYPLLALLAVAILYQKSPPLMAKNLTTPVPAAEFNHQNKTDWLNSEPLTLTDLKGKVVLLDFWTYGCWNCYRSFPWMNALEERLQSQGLQVIGVHTPEFDHEKVRANVVKKAKEFELHHPIMIDNDFSYWHAMGNRYWPSFYLIDKNSHIRHVFVGETHEGDHQAKEIEKAIKILLSE